MSRETPNSPIHSPLPAKALIHHLGRPIPLTIEQIDIVLRLISAARPHVDRVLDLGCGDGVVSSAILAEHPHAQAVVVDDAEEDLKAARTLLRSHDPRGTFVLADFTAPGWVDAVRRHGPFDVVIAGFATHHASDGRKREVFREIFDLLQPEGLFLNLEHVASATRWSESVWADYMIDAIFGEVIRESPGKSRAEIAHEYYERTRQEAGAVAPLEVQCEWLREIGFEHVETYLKVLELAVFGGQKPSA